MTSRGVSQAGTAGQSITAARTTRSTSRQATNSPPKGGNASPGDKLKKKLTAGEMSRTVLADAKCIGPEEQITPSSLYKIFAKVLKKYGESLHSEARVVLYAFETLLQENENQEQISNKMMDNIAKRVESKLENVLESGLAKMSGIVDGLVANQKGLQTATETLTNKTETLQKIAQEIGSSAKEASESTDQLSSTVTSYKEALLLTAKNTDPRTSAMQPHKTVEDPRLTRDLDRKNRQLLIEWGKEVAEGKSATELKEKIEAALQDMSLPSPGDAKIQEINKLRNGGVIVQLETKEIAKWLREPANKKEFIAKLDANAQIKERTYPLVVPRVPISFEPTDQEHLRELETVNNLEPNTISKARWIKPIYRRHPKQRVAYATISLSSASEANRLIRDGMYICSARTYPTRLKYEPKQCMKCRKWGHFASECHANADTCGTCGENHTTRDCNGSDKRFCVACKATDHASWDRACPEFQRKSAQFDEMHPENALTYFPTDESWTLTARPDRIPLEERFPSRYAVGSLPPPSNTRRQLPTREIVRKKKQRGQSVDGKQRTLDRYMESRIAGRQSNAEDETEEGQHEGEEKDVMDILAQETSEAQQ